MARPKRPLSLIEIGAATVLTGILFGASTNAVNGAVSETYFMSVMGWQDHVWALSVVQGVLEGFVFGILLSAVSTTTIGIVTRAGCDLGTGLRWLRGVLLAVYALWVLGGITGVTLAAAQPQFFHSSFIGVPSGRADMLRYAWVGGSIWGAYGGGLLAVIVGLILFRRSWRRMLELESPFAAGSVE
jgi:hypothetical protein